MEQNKYTQMEEHLKSFQKGTQKQAREYAVQLAQKAESKESEEQLYNAVDAEISSLKNVSSSFMKAYLQTSAEVDELGARLHDVKASRKKRRFIAAAPANSVIDLEEKKCRHFAQGVNLYKLFWVCLIGSFAGVVIEMIWCLVKNGYIESRAGLVYGPFNLLYGFGAAALTLALFRFRNRSSLFSFAGGMIVGSAVEYVCSWGQELVFGSRSWDYSGMPFNINGRICLLYSIFWGFLGVLWIKNLYPRMAKWILKIPNKSGKILTWVLAALLAFNAVVTVLAMARWSARIHGEPAESAFAQFIDRRFPDERMERIFANMDFD